MTRKRSIWPALTLPVVVVVLGLGAWLWYLRPENGFVWALTMLFLPGVIAGGALLKATGVGSRMTSEDRDRIRGALTGAGLLLAASLGFGIVETLELVSGDFAERALGVLIGVVLIVIGNALPKTLEPLAKMRCDPARVQALQRFSGWTFVLAGVAYSVLHVALPLDRAAPVATGIAATSVLIVAGRYLWVLRFSNRGARPPLSS